MSAWAVLAVAAVAACRMWPIGRLGSSGPRVAVADGPADNSRCHVCHINYEDEELAVDHAKKGIGCESCHGPSDAHCDDENNATPPQRMFPKAKVKPFCMQCHRRAKLVREPTHKPVLAGTATTKKHCTDCHGDHVMGERTVRWDKTTGKLLP